MLAIAIQFQCHGVDRDTYIGLFRQLIEVKSDNSNLY